MAGVRRASGEELACDLVVDAGGRRSALPSWLDDLGAAPCLDVAGRLASTTSGFSPALLAGQSQAQIADAVASPISDTGAGSSATATPPTGQAVLATANELSAGICAATGQQPARVCQSKGVLAADAALGLSRPAVPSTT